MSIFEEYGAFKVPGKFVAEDILKLILLFSEKIRLDILCLLKQTIHFIKCQV